VEFSVRELSVITHNTWNTCERLFFSELVMFRPADEKHLLLEFSQYKNNLELKILFHELEYENGKACAKFFRGKN
jgi:hypothetical protein